MIEQKLIVGRYIELNTPQPAFVGPAANGFREQIAVILHIDESESKSTPVAPNNPVQGFNPSFGQKVQIGLQRTGQQVKSQFDRQRVSSTGVGLVAKAHRNFVWLEWVPGIVNMVEPNGMDILTGPMTGCWIMSFLRNGVHYIGHVGTEQDHAHPNSVAAKAAWNAYAAGVPMTAYSGFNPFNDPWIAGAVPGSLPGESNRKTFALVTAAGAFYTVITYPQSNRANRIRIAGIQRNQSSLPQNGQI
jgi:hypothetical protein